MSRFRRQSNVRSPSALLLKRHARRRNNRTRSPRRRRQERRSLRTNGRRRTRSRRSKGRVCGVRFNTSGHPGFPGCLFSFTRRSARDGQCHGRTIAKLSLLWSYGTTAHPRYASYRCEGIDPHPCNCSIAGNNWLARRSLAMKASTCFKAC